MGVFNPDGSINSSFSVATGGRAASGGSFVGSKYVSGWKQPSIDWTSLAAQNQKPIPVTPQEQRIAKSFQTLPATDRLNTLNTLKSNAQNGDQVSARKLQYLTPMATQNIPTTPTYKPAPTFKNPVVNAVSNVATAAIGRPVASALNDVLGSGSAGEEIKQTPEQAAQAAAGVPRSISNNQLTAGKNQSVGSQAAGALEARFFVGAPAEKAIQSKVGDWIASKLAPKTSEFAAKTIGDVGGRSVAAGHQLGSLEAAGAAAQPGANPGNVAAGYGTGFATGAPLGGLGAAGSKVIGELRAPAQLAALQSKLGTQAKLGNLNDLLDHYQNIYNENQTSLGQEFAAQQAGVIRDNAANAPLGLPANASPAYDAGRTPGGAVMIDPNSPAARIVANAGKPGVTPTGVAVRPGVPDKTVGIMDSSNAGMPNRDVIPGRPAALVTTPGQNLTDIQAKGAAPETVQKAGASLVDKEPGLPTSTTAPTPKTDLPTLLKQWEALKSGGTSPVSGGKAQVTELGVLNSIIEHPDAPPDLKLAAMQDRHDLVHNQAKEELIQQEAKATGTTPVQAAESLAKGQGENGPLYQAIDNHQAAGGPQRIAYDYTPEKEPPAPAQTIERQQRNAMHTYIGKLDTRLQDTTRSADETAFLQKERQTAQDVLDGKRSFGDAFPGAELARKADTNVPGVRVSDKPALLDTVPKVQEGDTTRQAIVNRDTAIANTHDTFHAADMNKLAKKMAPEDWALFRKLDDSIDRTPEEAQSRIQAFASQAKNPKAFLDYANLQHQDAETVFGHRDALHPGEIGHVGNYQQRFYDMTDRSTKAAVDQHAYAVKNGKPGYSQHRVLPEYGTEIPKIGNDGEQVLDKNGNPETTTLKPKNANPHQDYLDMIRATANENGRAALVKGLNEAHPGQLVNVGVDQNGRNLGNLKISGARGLSIGDKKLQNFYNSRAPTQLASTAKEDRSLIQNARAGYKTVNKKAKAIELAGGLFHGARTTLATSGQQLLSLKRNVTHPIMQLTDNLHLIGSTFNKSVHDGWMKQLATDGSTHVDGRSTMVRSRVAGLTTTMHAVQGDIQGTENSMINRVPGFKQAYDAVFQRQIPAAKLMIFRQLTDHLDTNKPEELAQMREIAKGLNNGIGGINNYVSGLTPQLASAADNMILGRDLNEGILNTLGHSIKLNSTDGNLARQFVIGTSLVAALPGFVSLLASGKVNPGDAVGMAKAFGNEFLDPQIPTPWRSAPTSTNPKGNPITLKLPTTFISLLYKAVAPAINPMSTFDNSRVSGVENLASARLAAVPAFVEKMATNKDFYGNPIYGNGISPGSAALNTAEQFLPIPGQQILKSTVGTTNAQGQTTKQPWALTTLNELGLRGSSSTLPQDTGHSVGLNEYYNTLKQVQTQRSAVVKQINALSDKGQINQASRVATEWNNKYPALMKSLSVKYPNYDSTKDNNVTSLHISAKSKDLNTRQRNSASALKTLSSFQ